MNEFDSARHNDHLFPITEVSDEALESAAASAFEKSAAFTLAFCSGIDSCPSIRA